MTVPAARVPAAAEHAVDGELVSGVEALVRLVSVRETVDERDGLVTASMVSGYPGSPLGTFDLALESARERLSSRVVHRPAVNEELAMATVWGSQMGTVVPYRGVDGVVGLWYGKGPGLDRSGDALKHGNSMGSGPNGGVVVACGDDPAAKSSTLACDSQYTFEDACVPVLYPGDQQEVLDLGVHAFYMSRFAGCWVGIKMVTAVADGMGTTDLGADRHQPSAPLGVHVDGEPWTHRPLTTVGTHAVPGQEMLVAHSRLEAAKAYARHNGIDRVLGAAAGARLGVVCAGKTYFDVVQAFADLGVGLGDLEGIGIRVMKLGMTWPLVEQTAIEFASSVEEILVVEEKRPFVESQLRAVLHEAGLRTPVSGKRDGSGSPLVSLAGELDPSAVQKAIVRLVPELQAPPTATRKTIPLVPLPGRPPGFCSGCPHNRSTVFPDGALVGGGVGCHGIMYFEARHLGMRSMPPTPMGAEGVPWIGLAPFVEEPHLIQNLGDGTLSHSGTLAIRSSVAAGVDITFKILYNTAVAMTGGQEVTGLMDVPSMTRALQAEGVRRIVVCAEDPGHYGRGASWATGVEVVGRERLAKKQEELRQVPGVTVLIYDQRCAAEARRLRKRGLLPEPPQRVVINDAVCEGCGDCSTKSNCLSVLPLATEFGEKRQIHDSSCNRDYSCLEGDCPSFVTITPIKKQEGRKPAGTWRPLPAGDLPLPQVPEVESPYGIYFTGIGGTGVVTANRILASAARAAGFHVGGLDQTGLSQKAGAVVSNLHLARHREQLGSATIGSGGADLYLSGDILQAAGEKHLDKIGAGRTVAVVDRDVTPTAAMLQTASVAPDVNDLEAVIADRTGPDRVAFVDSKVMAEALFGNHLLANVILVGAAFQMGGLPFALDDLDLAIGEVSPGGAEQTRAAFAWGRWAAHDPATVAGAVVSAAGAVDGAVPGVHDPTPAAMSAAESLVASRDLPDGVRDLATRRTAQVIDYQDTRRGVRYLELVAKAAAVDSAARMWALTGAVADAWFKLLTYKDEYEVARLHLASDYPQLARQLGIDGPVEVRYHLHPPALRRLGLSHKLAMGRPYEMSFRALRAMKRLRETPLDPFGRDPDRRVERALIREYERLFASLGGVDYETAVRLARSPMAIRGYGPVKQAAVERWQRDVTELTGGHFVPRLARSR